MGQVSTEQTVAIIDSVTKTVEATKSETNYWWLLLIAVIPAIVVPFFLWAKKTLLDRRLDK